MFPCWDGHLQPPSRHSRNPEIQKHHFKVHKSHTRGQRSVLGKAWLLLSWERVGDLEKDLPTTQCPTDPRLIVLCHPHCELHLMLQDASRTSCLQLAVRKDGTQLSFLRCCVEVISISLHSSLPSHSCRLTLVISPGQVGHVLS